MTRAPSGRVRSVLLLSVVLLVGMATPSVASSVVARAKNADKVDHLSAVKSTASLKKRTGRLVATDKKTGLLPNDIIAKAPDAELLDGQDSTVFLHGATVLHESTTCPAVAFFPESAGMAYDTFGGERYMLTSGHLYCPLDLPVNATIRRMAVRGLDDDAGAHNLGCALLRDEMAPAGPEEITLASVTTAGASASYQTLNDETVAQPGVPVGAAFYVSCVLGTTSSVAIVSVSIDYDITPAGTTPQ